MKHADSSLRAVRNKLCMLYCTACVVCFAPLLASVAWGVHSLQLLRAMCACGGSGVMLQQ